MSHCQASLFDALHNADEAVPLKGANSFTEKEAKERVLGRGCRNLSRLEKDPNGIWRGTAHATVVPVSSSPSARPMLLFEKFHAMCMRTHGMQRVL
jgi:hypothetical protein